VATDAILAPGFAARPYWWEAALFARLPFPTAPGYTGRPWFMPAVIEAYRLRDRLQGWP
jgi:hypothetical protein